MTDFKQEALHYLELARHGSIVQNDLMGELPQTRNTKIAEANRYTAFALKVAEIQALLAVADELAAFRRHWLRRNPDLNVAQLVSKRQVD